MKREILFRGKAINTGEWVESMTICNGTIKRKSNCVYLEVNEKFIGVIPETVGQFTGLTDKNGVKIFEGHKIKSFHGAIYDVHDMIEFHTWIERTFRGNPEFEIIGNIYDNPR